MINIRETLDVSGKSCPIPLMKAKKVLRFYEKGDVLKLISTDLQTKDDLNKFCLRGKYELVEFINNHDGKYVFLIKKK